MISGFVEIDCVRLEVARWDPETDVGRLPVLLLHEGLGSVAMWRDFPALLSQACGRTVLACSRQGHGRSAPYPGERGPDYMHREAELLPALHATLGIKKAHWLGHSDGGSIALIAAALAPDIVASLILEAPHVFVEDVTLNGIEKIGGIFSASDMADRMKRYHDDPAETFAKWHGIWLRPEFRDWNIEACLADVAAPALLIQGLDDEYGTLEQLNRIEKTLPVTCRLELGECGHSPHRDRTSQVLQSIEEFLSDRN